MEFSPPLQRATLIQRYKRFLADVITPDGRELTLHCPNTGAMTGCATPGDTVWYSTSDNTKRKYPHTWELTQSQSGAFICVNTLWANRLTKEAILNESISELSGYSSLKSEVKYGAERSRIDFMLQADSRPDCYIEVKSVTLAENEQGYFPDAVTERGQKHLRELMSVAAEGQRAVIFFAVLHSAITRFSPARHIDEKYAQLLSEAQQRGVEILAYKAELSAEGMALMRVSMLPTVRGEKVVIRILDGQRIPLALSALGMDDQARRCLEKLIHCRQGLILICGPTGSGKTTTLYAAIHEIQDDSVSIATLEDPVEILMEGISQSQVQAKGGMMFQDGLRALLRQDPDILVVGEIRDGETARIAVRAALTGHVIFSTLHAPSAVEAVIRLTDMGVAPYLAADALAGVVSQRLVRRRRSDGSYQGRFCLCEVVPAGRHLRDAIRRCAGVRDLTDAARSDGAVLLPDVIARTLAAGRTDERAIRRVCEGGSSW